MMFTQRSLDSRTPTDFILYISCASLTKIAFKISPHTVKRFPVLLAPYSKTCTT